MSKEGKSRLLGRNIGRVISAQETENVGGGDCCYATYYTNAPTSFEGQTIPDPIAVTYDYYCQRA